MAMTIQINEKPVHDSNGQQIGVIHTARFRTPINEGQKKYVESYMIHNLFTMYNMGFTLYSEIHPDWAKIVGLWGENNMPAGNDIELQIP